MLRIISGKYKNFKISNSSLDLVRPSSERVREAIFDMIQFDIKNSITLELFAGSGIYSFEFISRGAMKSICIEKNYKNFLQIKKNQEKFKINNLNLVHENALDYVSHANGKKFNFIFIDAPYIEYALINDILIQIHENDLLTKEGKIIIETNNKNKIKIPKELIAFKEKKYGNTFVLIISKIL